MIARRPELVEHGVGGGRVGVPQRSEPIQPLGQLVEHERAVVVPFLAPHLIDHRVTVPPLRPYP